MVRKINQYKSLIVTGTDHLENNHFLIDILSSLGSVKIISNNNIRLSIQKKTFDLIIIDAVSVMNPSKAVTQIRDLGFNSKIVVLSASTHWKIAKAVIQAGATDYLSKSLSKEEMLSYLLKILI
ncbi:MAG: response regulator [Anaerolineales bacterium]|nr:response regulator [Anaerolineales bacterium]